MSTPIPRRIPAVAATAVQATAYALGMTLLDLERYPVEDLADLRHGWRCVEELLKISRQFLQVEGSRGRTEEAAKQELYAHFTLIAMARLSASHSERHFEARDGEEGRVPLRVHRNHGLGTVERELECLLLQTRQMRATLNRCRSTGCGVPSRSGPVAPARAGPAVRARNGGIATPP